ncbi:MAG: DUF5686 family protein, partial [Bacteroidales bacterium]
MKRAISFLLVFLLTSLLATAQMLKGKITNSSGEPVPYATIYIQELREGTAANSRGDYEIRIPAGKYVVIYQSMGYAPQYFNIDISVRDLVKDVILPMQYYQIPEVRISATGEDPAYGIMRKAIGMAPYYLNCVSYYKSDVYIKGSMVVKRIPKLFSLTISTKTNGEETKTPIPRTGDTYLMESNNLIEFTAPDKVVQKVLSINSTFPSEDDKISPIDFVTASFYSSQPVGPGISPLSPQSFSYYKFKYVGATLQGNNTINKIQVIPKMKSQQLFEGNIYIIEDLWCLHSLDLSISTVVGKINVQQIYIPVKNEIWMPVSLKIDADLSFLGVKVYAGYGTSIKYLEVSPNTSLHKPESVTSFYYERNDIKTPSDALVSKNQKKIEEILDKEKLTNGDMIKLAKLMEKESKETLPDSVRDNLEIKDNTKTIVEKDADKKDSSYWAEIRPIPLTDLEKRSIIKRDSVR